MNSFIFNLYILLRPIERNFIQYINTYMILMKTEQKKKHKMIF